MFKPQNLQPQSNAFTKVINYILNSRERNIEIFNKQSKDVN